MKRSRIEKTLSTILREYGDTFRIVYAILFKPHKDYANTLVLRFDDDVGEDESLRLRLDIATLLPPIDIDIYDYRQIPEDVLGYILRYGKIVYIRDYEMYIRDLRRYSPKRNI